MTATCKLDTDDYTFNMLTGTFYLSDDPFEFEAEPNTWITFSLKSSSVAATNRTALRVLDNIKRVVNNYNEDPTVNDGCWLTLQSDGEAAKRALVTDISYKIGSEGGRTPLLTRDGAFLELAVLVGEFEDTATSYTLTINNMGTGTASTEVSIASAQGYSTNGARIVSLSVKPDADMSEFWCGLRDIKEGLTYFDPVWECEAGTLISADSSKVTEAEATPISGSNNAIKCTFATTSTLAERFKITMGQVATAGFEEDMNGRYIVLCKIKGSATETIRVQLRAGINYSSSDLEIVGDSYITFTSSSVYKYFPIGYVEIGDRGAAGASGLPQWKMSVWAAEVGTVADVYFDHLVLMPADHFVHANAGANIPVYGSTNYLSVRTNEQDVVYGVAFDTAVTPIYYSFTPEVVDWKTPGTDFAVVFSCMNVDGCSKTLTGDLTFTVRDRYFSSEV